MDAMTKRAAQIAYVADLYVVAFYASRKVREWTVAEPDNYRATAIAAGARIARTDESGTDSDAVRETAYASLVAQDFRTEPVALFLDDLAHDAVALAREQRLAESL